MSKQRLRMIMPAVGIVAALVGAASPADAHASQQQRGAVFVQTNNPSGNQVAVYSRADDGTLSPSGRYDTGGNGGSLTGAVVDKLASQGSLTYDSGHRMVFAVNAGSGTLTSFRTHGTQLFDRQVLSTGRGSFPVSVAVHDDLVYVLDASGSGSVKGFRIDGKYLTPIWNSSRSLGLVANVQPQFLNTPGQIGFAPDGHHVVVTTKANGSTIDVFDVHHNGRLSESPTRTTSATPVPFGFVFDDMDRLVVGEAAMSTLSTYQLTRDDHYRAIASLGDNQAALCWITRAKDFYFVANAGSASVSAYTVDADGHPSLVGSTGIAASTDPGTIDLVASPDGAYLYVETGANGIVDAFAVGNDGSLHAIGTQGGLGTQQIEGIAAS
jgi:6-phosphogluconolactonase (cycloisomerase 2 family)